MNTARALDAEEAETVWLELKWAENEAERARLAKDLFTSHEVLRGQVDAVNARDRAAAMLAIGKRVATELYELGVRVGQARERWRTTESAALAADATRILEEIDAALVAAAKEQSHG